MEMNGASESSRYRRHTAQQIQQLEMFFKQCTHPDKAQMIQISEETGLKEDQVKYWFQNHRTQLKKQEEKNCNAKLKRENSNLKREIQDTEETFNNVRCSNCSGVPREESFEKYQLWRESVRINKEYEKVRATASRIVGPSFEHTFGCSPPATMCNNLFNFYDDTGALIMEEEKPLAMQLALSSVEEVRKMCLGVEPLWIQRGDGKEAFNVAEYKRMFPCGMSRQHPNQQLRTEATRATAVVRMNGIALVDTFLDAEKWTEMFPSIVVEGKNLQTVKATSGNYTGFLYLMQAEMGMLSPDQVPTKELHFVRYYCRDATGAWLIVDFPLDSLKGFDSASPSPTYKRKPSGCIIQDIENGYSRVTWIEHVEAEYKPVHPILNRFGGCEMAFDAEKWLAVLKRQSERLVRLNAQNIFDFEVIQSWEAKINLMNLGKRMLRSFWVGLSGSSGNSWVRLLDYPDDENVRMRIWSATEPGHPSGSILSVAFTTWLPYSHGHVFRLLRDERCRVQMEVTLNGKWFQRVAHIATAESSDPGNSISLLMIDGASSSSQTMEFILQESYADEFESGVAYTTLDSKDVEEDIMYGTDPSMIPVLPCGFVVVPMDQSKSCLLTISLQVVASKDPYAAIDLSSTLPAIKDKIRNIVQQIHMAFSGGSTSGVMP